jgi:phytoene dehydrogenase-like protein
LLEKNNFDVIVIGSGISALTISSILARINKKKVLILEQHSRIGGYTHVFSRKGYTWNVGFHYIGDIFNGKLAGTVLKFITDGKLLWHKTPEPFESFVYPDFTFNMYGEEKKFKKDLITLFPTEKKAISAYFRDVKKVKIWFVFYYLCRFMPAFLSIPLKFMSTAFENLALMYTDQYLNKRFKNEKLRSIIISQWGNYGLPPSKSAFVIHGLIATHFMNGGYYPEGGSEEIAKCIVPAILNNGGKVLPNNTVENIIIENGRAIGVTVSSKEKKEIISKNYYAPVIVSSAGAFNTFTKLIPDEYKPHFTKKCIEINKPSVCVALYLGLKGNVSSLGFTGANCWIYETTDHEKCFLNPMLLDGKPSSCFISFTPPDKNTGKVTTATIIASTNYSLFKQWSHQTIGKRSVEYYKLKEKIAAGLIEFVNKRYPGFAPMISYSELATPLSAEEFTSSPEGAMYGLPATPERYRQNWLSVKTPIKGLFLTGADISALGIVPSMMSGLATASFLNGPAGFFKIVGQIRRKCKK